MTWKEMFTSSIGKKLVMGFTGIFLILFLIVHVSLNATIWANDGGEMFNKGAHFMGGNIVPRILEIGLFVGLFAHIIQGYMLTLQNKKARSVGYAVSYKDGSKWYSRSMAVLGSLILIFLVMHLSHFWLPNRSAQGFVHLEGEIDLYAKMKATFTGNEPITILSIVVYLLGCGALCYHLAHGFQSAFKTIGVHNKKYHAMLTTLGIGFSVIVCVAFAMMPLSFQFGWID